MTFINDRRLSNGYSNLGPFQFPFWAQAIILTDRADGSLWMVSFNTSSPERLSINSIYSTIQRKEGVRLYAADDGPKMDEDGEFTLIIRSGRLGFEYNPFPRYEVARDDSPPYARQTSAQRLLIMDGTNPASSHIGTRNE